MKVEQRGSYNAKNPGIEAAHNKKKTEAELRTNSNVYNQGTKDAQLIHEIHNSAYNHRHILDAYKQGRAYDMSDEPKANKEPCIIIGSGPSLDDAIQYLKNWKYGIFCSSSHAVTLMYHGIEPTHIVDLDPFCMWKELSDIDWSKTKTKLIIQPGCWPDTIENWPNEMLLYRQDLGGARNFYNHEMMLMYTIREKVNSDNMRDYVFKPIIRTQMTVFACSPPAELFAAETLGYGRCFLVGCDFAYNIVKDRFTGYYQRGGVWMEDKHPYVPNEEMDIITNNGLITSTHHLYYKKNMLSAIRLSLQDVWVCGKGAITELKNVTPERMVKHPMSGRQFKKSEYIKVLEKYLGSAGAYVIDSKVNDRAACTFVESERPEVEILAYATQMFNVYKCKDCDTQMTANEPIRIKGNVEGSAKPYYFMHEGQELSAVILLLDINGEIGYFHIVGQDHKGLVLKVASDKEQKTIEQLLSGEKVEGYRFEDEDEKKIRESLNRWDSFKRDFIKPLKEYEFCYIDHLTDECPQCKSTNLRHKFEIDPDKVMKKILKYKPDVISLIRKEDLIEPVNLDTAIGKDVIQ